MLIAVFVTWLQAKYGVNPFVNGGLVPLAQVLLM
jgi:hypothetical protein